MFDAWLSQFCLEEKKGEISELLVGSPSIRALYTKMVRVLPESRQRAPSLRGGEWEGRVTGLCTARWACAEPGSCQEEADLPASGRQRMVWERPAKWLGSTPSWARRWVWLELKWGGRALTITISHFLCLDCKSAWELTGNDSTHHSQIFTSIFSSLQVPAAVSHSEFWHRYFYKVHQLEQVCWSNPGRTPYPPALREAPNSKR